MGSREREEVGQRVRQQNKRCKKIPLDGVKLVYVHGVLVGKAV